MLEIELSAGAVEYQDTGGNGPVLVMLHGLAMDGSLWRNVTAVLREDHRCIVPTLPLGGHRRPMRPTPTSQSWVWSGWWRSSSRNLI